MGIGAFLKTPVNGSKLCLGFLSSLFKFSKLLPVIDFIRQINGSIPVLFITVLTTGMVIFFP